MNQVDPSVQAGVEPESSTQPTVPFPVSGTVAPQMREQSHRRRRRRHHRKGPFRIVRHTWRALKRMNWLVLALGAIGSLAAIVMGAMVLVINAQNQIDNAWRGLNRDWQTISNARFTELTLDDFSRLQTRVRDLNASLASAKTKTGFLRPVTFLSADLDTSLESLNAAHELGLAANDILTGIQPTIFFLAGGQQSDELNPQFSSGARLVELLALGRNRFHSADAHLAQAQAIIDRLDLANVSPDVLNTFDGMAQYHRQLEEINAILLDAPDLLDNALGVSSPKTYLILSQNSDELRPSGGYISTYGWLQVNRGRVTRYDYYPTTATSPNPPDESLAQDLNIPDWWIPYNEPIYTAWDGSWSADFPTTARMAAWYYEQGNNPQAPVDGVIAIDLVGFEYLLQALGEVVVPGYNITVVPENFREMIYQIRAEGEGDLPHKQFLVALYQQIFDDWQQVDQAKSGDLRRAMVQALQEKHVMIYMQDEGLNAALDALGWSGRLKADSTEDFVMVVDANLGNKSNRSVVRQITYDAEIHADGTLSSRLAVSYEYFARLAANDPAVRPAHYNDINYHNLLQLLVAADSTLVSTNGFPSEPQVVPAEEYTGLVSYVSVDYDSSERYQVTYTTPVRVERFGPYSRYRLTLQKQPGTLNDFAIVQITLPPGASVVKTVPEPSATFELDNTILEFRAQLVTDKSIEIIFR